MRPIARTLLTLDCSDRAWRTDGKPRSPWTAPATPGEQDTELHDVIDLSAQVDEAGHTTWHPPSAGTWEILRVGYTDSDVRVSTSSDSWQGLAIDYLDRGAFDTYWDHTIAPLLEAGRPYLKTTLVNLPPHSLVVG